MEHTLAFRKEAKKLNVAESMLAMADLMAVGYKDIDAYKICYAENMQYPERQQKSIMESIIASAKFRKLLDARKTRVKESAIPVELDEVSLIDDDDVAKEILRSAMSAPVGSKERAELLIRYSDLRQRNAVDDSEKDGSDTVSFALPLKCNMCPLYVQFNKMAQEDNLGTIQPVEMQKIIDTAVKIAYPDAKKAYEILHGTPYDEAVKISTTY